MLNLTDSEKECFYGRGTYFNDYEFNFPDLNFTIANETLHQESVTIKESICDSEDLQLGGCIASSCEFEVSELVGKELAGLEFTARLLVNDGKDAVVQMGKYRVDSAKRVNDKDYRKITAYDALYDAQIDVSEWYNKVFYVVSQYEELVAVGDIDDLWEHGEYTIDNSGSKPPEVAFFLNGAVPEEAYDTTYLDTSTGKLYEAQDINKDDDSKDELYRWIEVYQCKRKTQTKYIYATTTLKKLRESLLNYLNIPFVEQDIINDDITISRTIDTNENGELLGTNMLKYICEVNAGFGKMNREGKFEVISLLSPGLYPEETLYPSEELYPEDHYEPIASDENSASYISTSYEEYEVEGITGVIIKGDSDNVGELAGTKDNPYVISGNPLLYGSTAEKLKEIGQKIYEQIKGYIYRPNTTTLDGLPYLETGDYFVLIKENSDDIGSFIFSRTLSGVQALKDTYESKGNKLRVNEDVQTSELMYLQSRTAKIQKSVDGVSIELANLDENTSSRFEQTASKIEAEVKRANNAEGELSGRITVTAGEITQEVTRAKGAEETLSGRITVTAGEITQEVTRATSEENTLRASISLKIDKDDDGQIISMINESADVITLNSNRLIVNSTNFTLDRNGAGSIGGWQFGKGYMYSDGDAFISTHSRTNYYNWDGFPYKASIMQGKLICGIQSGALDEAIPDTTRGYCDFSVAGIFAKDKKMSSGYLFAVGVENGVVTTNTGAFTASDRRLKTNITEIDEQYANNLIDGLKPSTYTMIDGKRTHSGFIADEVKMTAEKVLGTVDDFAAYATVQIDEDKKDYAALRYEEFIAPLTKYCQCLKRDLKQETTKNQQLQFQLLNLQSEFTILKQQLLGGN
ncbi:tail fiber domain-containing protein [Roseburia hominis]|nr:tail fiber domain-containing protein [Roseburia hominis]